MPQAPPLFYVALFGGPPQEKTHDTGIEAQNQPEKEGKELYGQNRDRQTIDLP